MLWAGLLALGCAAGLALIDPATLANRLGTRNDAPSVRPPLVLLTGLPIIWGEGDIGATLSGERRPSQSYRWLDRDYALSVIDRIDAATLNGRKLMMLAQPRALAPEELAALDAWVRAGGRALILTDPSLHWPSRYHFADPRAPPAISLLDPLLDHWGLRLDLITLGRQVRVSMVPFAVGADQWNLTVAAPGRFVVTGGACGLEKEGLVARCAIGSGKALLIADADLMADPLWGCADAEGRSLADCRSGNAAVIGTLLDQLSGISRDGGGQRVR